MNIIRKHTAVIYLLLLVMGTVFSLYMPKTENAAAKEAIVIPNDAIRLRILANSDKKEDQDLKRLVRDEVNKEITKWVNDLTSKEEARKVISGNQQRIQEIAERIVKEKGFKQSVKVKFGEAKFPTKLYGQYLYPAGSYEAIVITLGSGEGANWWCVLYPPLCFLDFSNGTAVSQSPIKEKEITDGSGETAEQKKDEEPKAAPVQETVQDNGQSPETAEPVYTPQDEQPVKVKFFVVELFSDLFN